MSRVALDETVLLATVPASFARKRAVTVLIRGTSEEATVYSAEVGAAVLTELITNDSGKPSGPNGEVPWVEEGSYELVVASNRDDDKPQTIYWEAAKGDAFRNVFEDDILKEAALPDSVVTDSAESPKGIDSTGINALDLLGYDGAKFVPADKAQIAAFANPFDSVLFIAGPTRENPTLQSQGMYIQHRVKGDLGGFVNDAAATELRLAEASNAGAGQNAFEASIVVAGGANSLASVNGLLANFKTEGEPTGEITALHLVNIQPVETLAKGLSIGTLYGLYVGAQSKGTTNYSLYVNGGTSVIRGTIKPSAKAETGLSLRGLEGQEGNLLTVQNSATTTLFNISAAGSVRIGSGLTTTATDGFLYLPSSNGPPTGVPTSQTGCIAFQYDRANNKLYAYNGGWKSVAVA